MLRHITTRHMIIFKPVRSQFTVADPTKEHRLCCSPQMVPLTVLTSLCSLLRCFCSCTVPLRHCDIVTLHCNNHRMAQTPGLSRIGLVGLAVMGQVRCHFPLGSLRRQ